MDQIWLNAQLNTEDLSVTRTSWGISNESWLVNANGKQYVWRICRQMRDRISEAKILEQVKDLDVPTVAFNSVTGEKLTVYIPGLQDFAQAKRSGAKDLYTRAGTLVRRLHARPAPENQFDPFSMLEEYQKGCRDKISLPFQQQVIEEAQKRWTADTFCHNDLTSGNLLFGTDRDWLIDYEFAGAGDWRFDLASFLSENQITDPKCRRDFLESYSQGRMDLERLEQEVLVFELFEDILWAVWAQMLYEQRGEEIFRSIRKDKEMHYKNGLALFNKISDNFHEFS